MRQSAQRPSGGKQVGPSVDGSELTRLDRDIERTTEKLTDLFKNHNGPISGQTPPSRYVTEASPGEDITA